MGYGTGYNFIDRTLVVLPSEDVQLLIVRLQDLNPGGEGTPGVTQK